MSDYKEFTGKTLDEAIDAACSHFSLERGKLEIEIVSGGSSGIFGLVGKKKAMVRARPRVAPGADGGPGRGRERAPRAQQAPKPAAAPEAEAQKPAAEDASLPAKHEESRPAVRQEAAVPAARPEAAPPAVVRRDEDAEADFDEDEGGEENFNRMPDDFERPLDDKELEAVIREIVTKLIEPIVGEQPLAVIQTKDRIKVVIEDEDSAGLLIGREGQTINSLQYLAGRILAKRWEEPVKIQLDAGQYRERQDDKLRQMALYLADKARTLGRPQSTKPLSSYHRRVVHLALQDDATVTTRSKGDGPMKRVLIMPRRERGQQQRQ